MAKKIGLLDDLVDSAAKLEQGSPSARVVGGRIVEMWSVADTIGAMVQLGLPLPAT